MTERTEATLDWIAIADSDIVALQEVTPALLSALKSDDRFANQHIATTLTDEELSASSWWLRSLHYLFGYQPWGQVILSHWPIQEVHVHPLGRPFLVADIEVDAVMLRVANCHLNSFAENHEKRTGQLEQIFRLLGSAPDVLLMGDFNFGDGSAEQAGLPTSYIDVWPRLHPDDPGYTFDPARNPLAAEGEISARIDRILLRSEHLLPLRVQLLSSSLRGPKASSDHFPVRAEFERKHAD